MIQKRFSTHLKHNTNTDHFTDTEEKKNYNTFNNHTDGQTNFACRNAVFWSTVNYSIKMCQQENIRPN